MKLTKSLRVKLVFVDLMFEACAFAELHFVYFTHRNKI